MFFTFLNCSNDIKSRNASQRWAFRPYQTSLKELSYLDISLYIGGGWVFLILPKKWVVFMLFSDKGVASLNREVILKRGRDNDFNGGVFYLQYYCQWKIYLFFLYFSSWLTHPNHHVFWCERFTQFNHFYQQSLCFSGALGQVMVFFFSEIVNGF